MWLDLVFDLQLLIIVKLINPLSASVALIETSLYEGNTGS